MKKANRAETPTEKIAKGEFILSTAESLARRDGLEGLSMNSLCAACGVAKGTLYLYFETRHEILAALFLKTLADWLRRFETKVAHGPRYDAFCETYAATLRQDPLLIPLMHHAHDNFEGGLPSETYQETLASFQRVLEAMAKIFCDAVNIENDEASRLVWAFYAAALGAGHFANSPKKRNDLVGDLAHFRDGLTFETMFLNVVSQLAIR